jgi:hypothetical protein
MALQTNKTKRKLNYTVKQRTPVYLPVDGATPVHLCVSLLTSRGSREGHGAGVDCLPFEIKIHNLLSAGA